MAETGECGSLPLEVEERRALRTKPRRPRRAVVVSPLAWCCEEVERCEVDIVVAFVGVRVSEMLGGLGVERNIREARAGKRGREEGS